MIELVEVGPGRWRVKRESPPVARSALAFPMVISDAMPSTEHVDGRFYESKSAFRAVTRAHGLTEVGNEKIRPKTRSSADPAFRRRRKVVIKEAIEKTRAGHHERYIHDAASRRAAAASRGDDT